MQIPDKSTHDPQTCPGCEMIRQRGVERRIITAEIPTIVCLCGSTRFGKQYQEAALRETLAGKIVLTVGCMTQSDHELEKAGIITDEVKLQLDELHKRKIDLADEVFVINVGGYIGSSTRSEIDYALSHGKPIRFLEPAGYSENAHC